MVLEVVYRPIDALVAYENNSRTHDDANVAKLAASISEFGFTNPVLIDSDGLLIAGHGRVLAAQQLGMAEVPCIELGHLTDDQRRAYVIADNRLALDSGWDEAALSSELSALRGSGYDLSLLGFDDGETEQFIIDGDVEGLTDDDSVPDLAASSISTAGSVWLLGGGTASVVETAQFAKMLINCLVTQASATRAGLIRHTTLPMRAAPA